MNNKATIDVAFCDGASSGNPGPGAWAYTMAFLAHDSVNEDAGYMDATTNNQMELQAVIELLLFYNRERSRQSPEGLSIYCDSQYVIKGAQSWVANWKKRGWKTAQGSPVANREYWEQLDELKELTPVPVRFHYVPGHSSFVGNERADHLCATLAAKRGDESFISRYSGDLKECSFAEAFLDPMKSFEPYYAVYKNGQLLKFKTWPECQKAVQGVKGVVFKKIAKKDDEATFLARFSGKH